MPNLTSFRHARAQSSRFSAGGLIAGVLIAQLAGAFPNAESNPLSHDAPPQRIDLHEFPSPHKMTNALGVLASLEFRDRITGREVVFRVTSAGAELWTDGEQRLAPTPVGDGTVRPFSNLSAGDINQDGSMDYILMQTYGGVGWAAGGARLTVFLSEGTDFAAHSFEAHFVSPENYVWLNGRPCLIHTSIGEAVMPALPCVEYYHVHNILAFDGATIRVDNTLASGFPKLVGSQMICEAAPFSSKTVLDRMTPEEREALIRRARESIFE